MERIVFLRNFSFHRFIDGWSPWRLRRAMRALLATNAQLAGHLQRMNRRIKRIEALQAIHLATDDITAQDRARLQAVERLAAAEIGDKLQHALQWERKVSGRDPLSGLCRMEIVARCDILLPEEGGARDE